MTDANKPKFASPTFRCPHCGASSQMLWSFVIEDDAVEKDYEKVNSRYCVHENPFSYARCVACGRYNAWVDYEMVYPTTTGCIADPGMPAAAKELFDEAQSIGGLSPRAGCVLLRACLERLCDSLNAPEGKLYKRIAVLDLSNRARRLFDICRRIGNEGAHDSAFDFSINNAEAKELFFVSSAFINQLCAELFSLENEIEYYERRLSEIKSR